MRYKTQALIIGVFILVTTNTIGGTVNAEVEHSPDKKFNASADLADPNWEIQWKYLLELRKSSDGTAHIELKDRLMVLLREVTTLREYSEKRVKDGVGGNQAEKEYYQQYIQKGYSGYAVLLAQLVSGYSDASTTSLVLRIDDAFSSEEINQDTYYSMGKGVFKELLTIAVGDKGPVSATAIYRLTCWANDTFNRKLDTEIALANREVEELTSALIALTASSEVNTAANSQIGLCSIAKNESGIATKLMIKKVVKKNLGNPSGYLREIAVRCIGEIGDADDIADLDSLKADTYVSPNYLALIKRGIEPKEKQYPVREQVRESIIQIRNRILTNSKPDYNK